MAGQDTSAPLWLPPAAGAPRSCFAVRSHACEPDQFGKPGGCSDICLLGNSHKTRTCRCRSGFSLGSDGKSCKSESCPPTPPRGAGGARGWGGQGHLCRAIGSTRAQGQAELFRPFPPGCKRPFSGLCVRAPTLRKPPCRGRRAVSPPPSAALAWPVAMALPVSLQSPSTSCSWCTGRGVRASSAGWTWEPRCRTST